MKVINVQQQTPEWLAWRSKGVGASDAATLLEVSPYKTPWRLWAEKTGYALPEDLSNNPNVSRGLRFEVEAVQAYEKKFNELLLPVCAESDKYPLIRASLDGQDSKNRPVEFKCPAESTWDDVLRNGEKSTAYKVYEPQVQHQLIVTGTDEGFLVFYNVDTKQLLVFTIKADKELHKELIKRAYDFWDSVEKRKEPKKDPEKDLFIPKDEQAQEWIGAAEMYRFLDSEIAEMKARIKELETQQQPYMEQMRDLMGNYRFAEFCGVSITRYRSQGRVDYKRIVDEHLQLPEHEVEQYRADASERQRVTVTDSLVPRRIVNQDVAESLQETTGVLQTAWF